MHYVAYLDNPNRRVEVDADTFKAAQQVAAELLDTKRTRDVQLIETPAPKHSTQDLAKDTTEDTQ